jgi:enhancing lycopene biosynthesis protein 2
LYNRNKQPTIMRKLLFLLLFVAGFLLNGAAQSIPRGMKYQAVARDLKGEILANAKIELRISLLSKAGGSQVSYYSELHSVITNQLGLFTLVVGDGKMESGEFDNVPWATSDIWMEIQIKANGQPDFTSISNSQLLAVPYAYYAASAGSLVKPVSTQKGFENSRCPCEGGLSEIKVLYQDGPATPVTIKVYRKKELTELIATFTGVSNGAILTVSAAGFADGKLKENTYFQVLSPNIAVVEVPSECEELKEPWEMSMGETFGNFSVLAHKDKKNGAECTVCDLRKEWHVGGNGLMDLCNMLGTKSYTDLIFITNNTERLRITKDGDINISNNLQIGNNLTVKNNVYLNTVGGSTINNGPFSVNNISPTYLTGSLTVDKMTRLNGINESLSPSTGALVVMGGTGIVKRLNVGGMAKVWDATQSTSPTIGALVVMGGAGIGMNLNVGGTATVGGIVNMSDLTQSTATTNGALIVAGGVGIGKNLNVGGAANFGGSSSFSGILNISDLTQSTAPTNGALIVGGGVGIGKNLNVGGNTILTGNEAVNGGNITTTATTFNLLNTTATTINAFGAATSLTIGSTTGMATIRNTTVAITNNATVGGTMGVTGATTLNGATTINNNLTVSKDDAGFVASIVNSNTSEGDGLQIKLGKTHPAWNGSSYLNVTTPAEVFDGAINTIKGWVIDHNAFSPEQLLTFIPAAYIAGTACNVVNQLTSALNNALGLPIHMPSVEVFPGFHLGLPDPLPNINIGSVTIGGFTIFPSFPTIPCGGLPSLSVPNISFTNVGNSLTNNNQFISFVDKDNRELGSIRAQSVTDWEFSYLDGTFFVNLMAGMVGIDLVNGIANAVAGFTNIAKSYNQIGVEYASGHGDYAEWLERSNPEETISAGDIVGVKGGKVSKNLQGAEQILAVSHNPIVLGNAPTKEREIYGNKIAFTGQVPVKVVGPVNMGDYIIAKGEILGYGIAVRPADLTTDDLKLAVGRSWETNLKDGPKMVNTLIGVDNGDYIKIMKEGQDKITTLEMRMKAMEEKLDNVLTGKTKRSKTKKNEN